MDRISRPGNMAHDKKTSAQHEITGMGLILSTRKYTICPFIYKIYISNFIELYDYIYVNQYFMYISYKYNILMYFLFFYIILYIYLFSENKKTMQKGHKFFSISFCVWVSQSSTQNTKVNDKIARSNEKRQS